MADIVFKAFKGLRNDVDPERFDAGDLQGAVNIDLDDSGKLSVRDGYAQALSSSQVHSLWSNNKICLYGQGTNLRRLHANYTSSLVRSGLSGDDISYTEVNGRIYYSNGTDTGVVDTDGAARSWGLEVPGLPTAANGGGALASGTYLYAMTFLREDGQESGAGLSGRVDVTTGGIEFTNIPVSSDPTVVGKNLYVTTQNGDVLYRAAIIENSTTTFNYLGGILSTPLATQFLQAPPPGDIVAYNDGYVYIVDGSTVYYSRPYAYELFDVRAFLPFSDPIRIFAPVSGGIWVGTDKEIIWLEGKDPAKMRKESRVDVGSLKGTLTYVDSNKLPAVSENMPDTTVALWWSDSGACAGYPGGLLNQLTESRYLPANKGEKGAGLVRQTDSGAQYLVVVKY